MDTPLPDLTSDRSRLSMELSSNNAFPCDHPFATEFCLTIPVGVLKYPLVGLESDSSESNKEFRLSLNPPHGYGFLTVGLDSDVDLGYTSDLPGLVRSSI